MLRLRSVPSVGPVTAAAFLAALDDAQRFRHAHQLTRDKLAQLWTLAEQRSSS